MAIGGHTETIEVVMVAGPTNDIVRVVKYKVSMAEGNQKSHSQFCESAKLLLPSEQLQRQRSDALLLVKLGPCSSSTVNSGC